MTAPDARQEAFEAWALDQGLDIEHVDPADQEGGRVYSNVPYTQLAWEAWKAATGQPTIDQTGIIHGRSFYSVALSDEQMIEMTGGGEAAVLAKLGSKP